MRETGGEAQTKAAVHPTRVPIGLGDAPAWVAQATLGFVVLGVLLRATRYMLNFPLWCDETMIAANFLDCGYADLLRPLDYRQVAPVLWLAVELSSVKLLGFSEWTLRLFPFLCGVASVPLFRRVAGRLLTGVPLLLAVGLFAVSGWPLKYVAEVKPYGSDLFVALTVLAMALEWWRSPGRVGWLWGLAAFGPVAVGLSFPSLFVLGGVGLALGWPAWKSGRRDARLALGLFGLGVVATFVALAPYYKTAPQDHAYFQRDWAGAFPPLTSPGKLAFWLLDVNTGYLFAYPEGGAHGASTVTFLAFLAGAFVLAVRGRGVPLALALLPFALTFVAAAMHRYPYGVSARTSQYVAPIICLLAGLGWAASLAVWPWERLRHWGMIAGVALLALVGTVRFGYDLSHPFKTPADQRIRSFAQWFWTELARDGELVCLNRDLGVMADPRVWQLGATHTYLCYQRIYSPRHRAGAAADLARVSARRPLRCVVFNEFPEGKPPFDAWVAETSRRFSLRRVLPYPVSTFEPKPGPTQNQVYVVYEFVPRVEAETAAGAAGLKR